MKKNQLELTGNMSVTRLGIIILYYIISQMLRFINLQKKTHEKLDEPKKKKNQHQICRRRYLISKKFLLPSNY